MNKTININLAGIIFHVDEDAYKQLNDYLDRIKSTFANSTGSEEIIQDIEARMAELFQSKLNAGKQVINTQDVNDVIAILGQPEDYIDEDYEKEKTEASNHSSETYRGPKRLYRNPDDKIVAGVASGVAAYFNMDPVWIRLLWVALTLGFGTGFWLYIILWIVLPEAKTTAQKLQMKGEPINISNIEKAVKEEIKGVQNRVENFAESGSMSKIRRVLDDLIQLILNLTKGILGFALKFIGFIFLIIGLFVLVMVFSLLFGYGITINDNNVLLSDLGPYMEALLSQGISSAYVWMAIVLSIALPLVGAIVLAVRILFNYRGSGSKIALISGGLASFIGFILLLNIGIRLIRDFEHRESYTKVEQLSKVKSDAIRLFADNEDYNSEDAARPWIVRENKIILDDIQFNILPSEGSELSVTVKSFANGMTRKSARSLASEIDYFVGQDSDRVHLAGFFSIDQGLKYRAQELKVTLNMPLGHRVYLDESMSSILQNISNVQDVYDMDMVGHWWLMTEQGLSCQDCPIMLEKNDQVQLDENNVY